ncbi:MAG: BrnT family toxin [Rhodospirillales bacterium]|nr:BrnT family toxin [Rhodospirillales bacterium]
MAYNLPCDFEWDEVKSHRCETERGFGFADILPAFADPARRIEPDERREYGEDRFRLLGLVGERLFVIAFTMRGRTVRIISARKASARERRFYGEDRGKA